ncbi:XdhC family protein [Streptomyces sp. NPDC002851]
MGEAGLVGGAGSVGRAGRVGGAGSVGWAGRVGEAESVGGAGLVGEAVESVGGVELAGPIDPVGGAEAVDGAGRVGEAVESVGGVELAGPIDPVGGAEAVDGAGLVGEAVESVGGVESVGPIAPVVGGQLVLGAALFVRSDGSYDGGLGGYAGLDGTAAAQARALLAAGRTGTVELAPDGSLCPGGLTLFVETRVPPPRMIVFGAIDFAAALTRAGKFLGYHVTVCDGRPVFATSARFPAADEIVIDWPHRYLRRTDTDERTVLCVLTHDAKFDVPLLQTALRMPVAYVGAMGSRRTHEDRNQRLREAGVTERELSRLRSPIGLDLGARTPEETAVSIAAEIVAARYGGAGTPLTGSGSSIHRG